jgi:hypothetical protein
VYVSIMYFCTFLQVLRSPFIADKELYRWEMWFWSVVSWLFDCQTSGPSLQWFPYMFSLSALRKEIFSLSIDGKRSSNVYFDLWLRVCNYVLKLRSNHSSFNSWDWDSACLYSFFKNKKKEKLHSPPLKSF